MAQIYHVFTDYVDTYTEDIQEALDEFLKHCLEIGRARLYSVEWPDDQEWTEFNETDECLLSHGDYPW